jgi:hypothetical protein
MGIFIKYKRDLTVVCQEGIELRALFKEKEVQGGEKYVV